MDKTDSNSDDKFQISEMWLAEAGDKCFYGIIKRTKDARGIPHLFSRIVINDGLVQACSSDQRVLSRILDDMCIMYLNGLHSDTGKYLIVNDEKYFLN